MNVTLSTQQDSTALLPTVWTGIDMFHSHDAPKCTAADAECSDVCAMLNEAWAAVAPMDGSLSDEPQTFSFCNTSDSGEAWCDTETRFPASHTDVASESHHIQELYLGLMTVCGLIEISQATLRRSTLSGDAKDEAWLALARECKAAGRTAYSAVVRLADPQVNQFKDGRPGPSSSTTAFYN